MAIIIYHERNAITCYMTGKDTPLTATIPATVVSDLDIKNEDAYAQAIRTMVSPLKHVRENAMLILSDQLCFAALTSPTTKEDDVQKLISSIPFAHVETAMVNRAGKTFAIATNAELYESASRAFSAEGITITSVIPWSAISALELFAGPINQEAVKKIYDARDKLRASSFAVMNIAQTNETPTASTTAKKPGGLSKGVKIFLMIALAYALIMVVVLARQYS